MSGLTIGSLCSGACDGMSLGFEWAGIGPVVWQVEIDHERRANLARHWPNAERFADVRNCGAGNLRPVDVIVCSAPCQDVSSAGKGAGLSGARSGLWFEFRRVVEELKPSWVGVENVAGGRASGWTLSASTWKSLATRAYRSRLRRTMLAHPIAASVSSLLPTLTRTANLLSPSMQKWPSHRLLPEVIGCSPCPTWCEWFLGFATDWTLVDAALLETQSSPNAPK